MLSANGPPIRTRIRDLDGGLRIRESYGDTPSGINRADISVGKGWQDYAWLDKETGEEWHLWNADRTQLRVAELGRSAWAGKGPTVPAERGCGECHKTITAAIASDEQFRADLITQIVAIYGDWGRKKDKPVPAPVPMPQRGETGPRGPEGPRGLQGESYKLTQADKNEITAAVRAGIIEWILANADEFKGGAGKSPTDLELLALIRKVVDEKKFDLTGPKGDSVKGDDGKPGTVTVRVLGPNDTLVKEFQAVRTGSTVIVRAKEFEKKGE